MYKRARRVKNVFVGDAESSLVVCYDGPPQATSYHQLMVLNADGSSRVAHAGLGQALGYAMDSRGCVLLMNKDWTLHVLHLRPTAGGVKIRALRLGVSEDTKRTPSVRSRTTLRYDGFALEKLTD